MDDPDENSGIDKLSFDENRVLPRSSTSDHGSEPRRGSYGLLRDDVSLLSIVVEGVIERDRQRLRRRIIRSTSFASAVLSWFVCFFFISLPLKWRGMSMHANGNLVFSLMQPLCRIDRGLLPLRSSPHFSSPLQPVSSQCDLCRRGDCRIPDCPARRLCVRPLQPSSGVLGRSHFLWQWISTGGSHLPSRSAR